MDNNTGQKPTLESIIEEYRNNDICMAELLAATSADGLDIEEAFMLYVSSMKWADGGKFFQLRESELTQL